MEQRFELRHYSPVARSAVRMFIDTACFGIGACCFDGIATLCGGAATCATLLGATVVLRCVCVVERDIVCDT